MKRFIVKDKIKYKNVLIIIGVLICMNTSILINTIGKKSTSNIIYTSKSIINTLNTNVVNNNIKSEIFKKYKIDDLIDISYRDNKINDVNYNLERAYDVLIEVKNNIINSISNDMNKYYNYKFEISNNNIVVEIPFYNYTNNIFLVNLGPKVIVNLSMVRLIDGSVKTRVKTYGINSLLIELYLDFTITSDIVIPYSKEGRVENNYEVLLSSKVVEGEVPSMYNGVYESRSSLISE